MPDPETPKRDAEDQPVEGAETAAEGQFRIGDNDPLSSIRHALRTPLNQIIGYCELLMEEAEDLDQLDFIPDLQKIHTAGGQLLALINDTLAPWKLETGTIDLDSMRLEMRTPLNLIIGYSELCQDMAEESQRPKLIPDLQKIAAAARNLLALFESTSFPAQMAVTAKASRPGSSAQATLGRSFSKADKEDREPAEKRCGAILLADDNEMNRDMLCRRLERQGYSVTEAENGYEAMELLKSRKFDLVLLDVIMPRLDGYETLKLMVADKALRHIPVIMLSALDELDNVIKCIEIGAEDYVTKPYNPILLNARIAASLEKKQLRDQEQDYLEILQIEREKSERLLLNVMPRSIAERLKAGESTIADIFPSATVLHADIADFTQVTTRLSPTETVELLSDIFSQFDWLAELHGLEKIKTIADAYIAVGGLPVPRPDHAAAVAEMALEMQKVIRRFTDGTGFALNLRIGISTGPVIAGVIGRKKFLYDLWGDTVKIAGLLEVHGGPGKIQVSPATYEKLRDKYQLEPGGQIDLRGKGPMDTYVLSGRTSRIILNAVTETEEGEKDISQARSESLLTRLRTDVSGDFKKQRR